MTPKQAAAEAAKIAPDVASDINAAVDRLLAQVAKFPPDEPPHWRVNLAGSCMYEASAAQQRRVNGIFQGRRYKGAAHEKRLAAVYKALAADPEYRAACARAKQVVREQRLISGRRVLAVLGRLQRRDIKRAKGGGHVTAITRDHQPALAVVDPADPLRSGLTRLGWAVYDAMQEEKQK